MNKPLAKREWDVTKLIGKGLTNAEIATELSLSILTIREYTGRIFRKLNIHSRLELAIMYHEGKISEPLPKSR